jgi:hypothetical protein
MTELWGTHSCPKEVGLLFSMAAVGGGGSYFYFPVHDLGFSP